MADKPMVVLVATYSGMEAAEMDYKAVMGLHKAGDLGHIAAAIITKDAEGKLKISRHDTTAKHLAWGGAILGSLLAIIAPPLGLVVMTGSVVGGIAAGAVVQGGVLAGAGGIIGHYWHNISKKDLRELGDALEVGAASLVVVAVEKKAADVEGAVVKADSKIVKKIENGDVEGAFNEALAESVKADNADKAVMTETTETTEKDESSV